MALTRETTCFESNELSIPRATMNKMIRELFPNLHIAAEARELISACCAEFIHHLSTEANRICSLQQKKIIAPSHVLGALESLGFGAYCRDLEAVLGECTAAAAAKRRRQSTRLEYHGIPDDQLLRQQQELFAEARQQLAQQESALAEQQQLVMGGLNEQDGH